MDRLTEGTYDDAPSREPMRAQGKCSLPEVMHIRESHKQRARRVITARRARRAIREMGLKTTTQFLNPDNTAKGGKTDGTTQ